MELRYNNAMIKGLLNDYYVYMHLQYFVNCHFRRTNLQQYLNRRPLDDRRVSKLTHNADNIDILARRRHGPIMRAINGRNDIYCNVNLGVR